MLNFLFIEFISNIHGKQHAINQDPQLKILKHNECANYIIAKKFFIWIHYIYTLRKKINDKMRNGIRCIAIRLNDEKCGY